MFLHIFVLLNYLPNFGGQSCCDFCNCSSTHSQSGLSHKVIHIVAVVLAAGSSAEQVLVQVISQ